MKKLNNLILSLAGFDKELVDRCSKSSRLLYYGIAISMYIPVIMAFVAFYSFASFYKLDYPIGIACLGSLLVLILEVSIMRTFKPREKQRLNYWSISAFFRLAISIALCYLMSFPIDLKLFEEDIRTEMAAIQRDKITSLEQSFQTSRKNLNKEYSDRRDKLNEDATAYYNDVIKPQQNRVDNYKRTADIEMRTGYRRKSAKKTADQNKQEQILNGYLANQANLASKIDSLDQERTKDLARLSSEEKSAKDDMIKNQSLGILAMTEAYASLKKKHPSIWWKWLAFLVFIMGLDLIGIISKYSLTKDSEYYVNAQNSQKYKLALNESIIQAEHKVEKKQQKNELKLQSMKLTQDLHTRKAEMELNATFALSENEIEAIKNYCKNIQQLLEVELDDQELKDIVQGLITVKVDETLNNVINKK